MDEDTVREDGGRGEVLGGGEVEEHDQETRHEQDHHQPPAPANINAHFWLTTLVKLTNTGCILYTVFSITLIELT